MRVLRIVCAALVFGASLSAYGGQPSKKDRNFAIELFKESKKRYRDGEFEAAAKLLEEAYAIDPAPTLLYNLARAKESAGDLEGAVDAYRRYLEADPAAKDRGAIEKRIENLDRQLNERAELEAKLEAQREKAAPAPPPAPPPPVAVTTTPEPTEPEVSPVPWIIAGVGAAVIGSGVVLGVLASGKNSDAMNAPSQIDTRNLADEAGGLAAAANASYIAGGIVVGAGLVWGIVSLTTSGDEELAVLPVLGPRQAGVVVRY